MLLKFSLFLSLSLILPQDFEFVVTNKVTHIINCAGKQIPNYWETVGVAYLTYDWMDSENQVFVYFLLFLILLKIVFDNKGEVVNEIFAFIEDAVKLGEGVLVHSLKGQSRSCCVLTAYFMKRFPFKEKFFLYLHQISLESIQNPRVPHFKKIRFGDQNQLLSSAPEFRVQIVPTS